MNQDQPGSGRSQSQQPGEFSGSQTTQDWLKEITARKKTEEELRKSEEHLRQILDATPFPVAVVDPQDDKIQYWSRSALTIFGHTAPTAAEWYEIAYPDPDYRRDVVARWKPALDIARNSRVPVNTGEYKVTCRDGSLRICELFATFIADNLIVTFNDITDRKHMEQALLTNEAQFSNALRMAHAGHWEYDVLTDTFIFNDNFYQIFRTTAEEVGGYTMTSAEYARRFCHPDDMFMVQKETEAAIKTDNPYYGRELEHRIVFPDGETGFVAVRFFIVKDQEGRTIKTYGVNQDITESKNAQVQLSEQINELKRWQQITLGRETRVLELKREVNELLAQRGKPPRYPSATDENS